jgi:hypothetical protein
MLLSGVHCGGPRWRGLYAALWQPLPAPWLTRVPTTVSHLTLSPGCWQGLSGKLRAVNPFVRGVMSNLVHALDEYVSEPAAGLDSMAVTALPPRSPLLKHTFPVPLPSGCPSVTPLGAVVQGNPCMLR